MIRFPLKYTAPPKTSAPWRADLIGAIILFLVIAFLVYVVEPLAR